MKRSSLWLMVGLLVGCGASNPKQNMPDWYMSATSDEDYFVATGEAESRRRNLAITAATDRARVELAKQAEVHVENLFKDFQEQSGDVTDPVVLEQITNVSKTVTKRSLRGSNPVQKDVQAFEKPDGRDADQEPDIWYRGFVMVELSRASVDAQAVTAIRTEDELYTRFRATEAYKELESATSGVDG